MRALVTGASGFVGRHLLEHLRACGDEVTGIDRAHGGIDPAHAGIDIADVDAVAAVLADTRPEAVYHLAGWSDVGGSWDAPVETFRANAEGTLQVLRACRAAGVGRVVAVSSADVYGAVTDDELPLTEDAPLRPVSPYAASKVAADFVALQAWLGHKLEVLRVRAFNHLGPGQSDRFVAPAIAHRIARNEHDGGDTVPVGDLTPRRDVTDVRDVVRAYRLLVLHGEPGVAYNVCSGVDVAVGAIAEQLVAMATRPMQLVHDPARVRPVDIPVLRGDCSRLRRATGWAPEIPLATTLTDVLADWRDRVAAERTTAGATPT